jgi:hypothetical protein
MLPREDQKHASNTVENNVLNRVFLKRLSNKDAKVMFIDTSCRKCAQQKVTEI